MATYIEGELVQFTIEEPAAGYWRIVFSNPPINLLNSTTVVELDAIVRRIEEGRTSGSSCCERASRLLHGSIRPLGPEPRRLHGDEDGVTLFIDSMLRMRRAGPITIASIRGRARGGGSEFALSCDLRFASIENAILGQPEVGVGIVPAAARSNVFRLVGSARALEIIASSDDYDRSPRSANGWINRAIPDSELDDYVDKLARRLASFDTHALSVAND